MKCLHLSDLHLGKRLMEVSLLEDQAYILDQIADIAEEQAPEVVMISGDVYDRSNPPAEAMAMFGRFLKRLTALGCRVMVIAGNHDSALRVAYLGELVRDLGVYLSPVYDGHIEPVTLADEHGIIHFWLLPFIHPEAARPFFPEEKIECANDAARLVLSTLSPDVRERNVILSHQFIQGSAFDDREQRNVGTLDNVDPALYDDFDYVALGHIHRPQSVGRSDGTMRYCGTPLKYSKKEAHGDKTVTVVNLGAKGDVSVSTLPLKPLREVRTLRGFFDDLMAAGPEAGTEDDYSYITLLDELDIPNAAARLRERFGRVLAIDFDNRRTRAEGVTIGDHTVEDKTPLQLIGELYALTHGDAPLSDQAAAFLSEVLREMGM